MLQFRRFVKAIFQRILRHLKAAQSMDVLEYQTQCNLTSVFHPQNERFRPMITSDFSEVAWSGYRFENRRRPSKTELFPRKIADCHRFAQTALLLNFR